MTHQELKEALPLYALDALEEPEAKEVAGHVATCAECRWELDAFLETSADLAHSVDPVPPPPGVLDRALNEVRPRPFKPASGPRPASAASRFLQGALAMAFAGLVASVAFLWNELRETRSELARLQDTSEFLTSTAVRIVDLEGTEEAPRARGRLAFDPRRGDMMLVTNELPTVPKDKAFQLWFIAGEKPIPGNVFRPNPLGRATLRGRIPEHGREASTFAVTIEPETGVPAPTGEMVLVGKRS